MTKPCAVSRWIGIGGLVASVLAGRPAAAETVMPATCDAIPTAISAAVPGTLVLLPGLQCTISSVIAVPSGVRIVGRPGTVLVVEFPDDPFIFPALDLGASTDVEISGLTFRLQNRSAMIRAEGGQRLTISDVRVEGTESTAGTAGVPIRVDNMNEVLIERVRITDSYGGIYVVNSRKVTIQNNTLARVNFGNIVVSGVGVWVLRNSIDQPGLPTPFHAASGDGITLEAYIAYAVIQGNTIRNGFCYGIAGSTGSSNLDITGNTIERGQTSGIYLVGTAGTTISGNVIRQNRSYGITLDMPSYTTVTHNQLYGNGIWVAGSYFGRYVGNQFTLAEPMQYFDGHATDVIQH